MATALIALGSNQGDRAATIAQALKRLAARDGVALRSASRLYATDPIGGPAGQPEFLNGAALVDTTLTPEELLAALLDIETQLGRVRGDRWGARPIDLDLLNFERVEIASPTLTLPHPRMAFRRFVLAPAAEIAPDVFHLPSGRRISQLLEHLESSAAYLAIAGPPASGKTDLMQAAVRRTDAKALYDRVDPTLLARLDAKPITGAPAVEKTIRGQRALRLSQQNWPVKEADGSPSRTTWCVSDFWFGQNPAYAAAWLQAGKSRGGESAPDARSDAFLDALLHPREVVVRPRLLVLLEADPAWLAERIAARRRPHEKRLNLAWCQKVCQELDRIASRQTECPVLRLSAAEADQTLAEVLAAMQAASMLGACRPILPSPLSPSDA